ncbi:hypothetical protein A5761_13775 [Mycolicibacterium setense]|uniref:hypothetical protein n=1 Tax=Mycolicibacterium setense TaxID=431269 RepID=UPI0007EB6130|nr:hypothetical protein [Mycolicibacterium setense]OBB15185.1 hypothetical protein A5761_13775 [Mycolicibacterium setense]
MGSEGASNAADVVGESTIKRTCFIVAPIGDDGSEIRKRSDQVKKYIIDPAVTPLGYETTRADLTDESGLITTHIVTQLLSADLIIADLSGHNPNVFYELAIRHAFAKPFIQIIGKGDRLPFDVAGQLSIFFDHRDLDSVEEAKGRIHRIAKGIRDVGLDYKADNPVVQTVDLLQLRNSGNPEQVTMAEVSESLADIRKELRLTRRPQTGYSSEQMVAIRKVLIAMALDGRLGTDDFEELSSVPLTRNYEAFLDKLSEEMAKPHPADDPWSSPPQSSRIADDEPPF